MKRRSTTLILALLLLFQLVNASPPEENRMRAGNLPTPFTAEEIKAHCKPGYSTKHIFENAGLKPVIQIVTFLESEDPTKARFSSRQESTTGELVSDDGITEIGWDKLQAHGSFLDNVATVKEATLELDGTSYDCWKYEINNIVPNHDGSSLNSVSMTMWFAKNLPGPPVKMVQFVNGEKQTSITLIQDKECCEGMECCEGLECCDSKVSPPECEASDKAANPSPE